MKLKRPRQRLGRRPASEAATNRNMNIALLYATYRVTLSLFRTASRTSGPC